MFETQKRIQIAGLVAAIGTAIAIEVFGAPPVTLVVVTYVGAAVIAKTQDWARTHRHGR